MDGRRVKLQIWDTAGQERFRTITQAYYRQASSILLVFDICDQVSFDHIGNWMQSIKQHNTSADLFISLVGAPPTNPSSASPEPPPSHPRAITAFHTSLL
eukprot:COSAG05_NODE_3314_length_2156_cov_3.113272_1_plen_100_part_00